MIPDSDSEQVQLPPTPAQQEQEQLAKFVRECTAEQRQLLEAAQQRAAEDPPAATSPVHPPTQSSCNTVAAQRTEGQQQSDEAVDQLEDTSLQQQQQQQLDEPSELTVAPGEEEEMDDFDLLGILAERYHFDDEDGARADVIPTGAASVPDVLPDDKPGPSGVSPSAVDVLPALSECVGVPVFATPNPTTATNSSVRRNPARAAKQGVSYVEEEEDDIHEYCEY